MTGQMKTFVILAILGPLLAGYVMGNLLYGLCAIPLLFLSFIVIGGNYRSFALEYLVFLGVCVFLVWLIGFYYWDSEKAVTEPALTIAATTGLLIGGPLALLLTALKRIFW